MTSSPLNKACWIWLAQENPVVNQYVCFRKHFALHRAPNAARMEIAVDSDFVLWVNGRIVGGGQFSDWPREKTFTRYDLTRFLLPGANTVAIAAYYRGADFSDYCTGQPGLIAAIECDGLTVATDDSWKARQDPAMVCGPVPKVTGQMGFVWQFDARLEQPWQQPDYRDNDWPQARTICGARDGYWKTLSPRPVPPLKILGEVEVSLQTQGEFRRTQSEGSVAQQMFSDALVNRQTWDMFVDPQFSGSAGYSRLDRTLSHLIASIDDKWLDMLPTSPGADGRFVIFDLGREEVGYVVLKLRAPAGTVLDIGHGEHLDDGRVRTFTGGRNFADRYICKEGLNEFTFRFRRIGARFLQVHFWNFTQPISLNYVGLAPAEFPLQAQAEFQTHDALAQKVYEVSLRTMHLCMHEHYEDCPWREQSLYAFDSRNQALYGYYALGNYDFAQASIDLLGRGIRDDGLLQLTAPGNCPVTIPIFSLVWISELAEHWMHSGSDALFVKFADQARSMLETALRRNDAATGLYQTPSGKGIWMFYEWMDGLSLDFEAGHPPDLFHAPYNLFLLESLQSFAWMLRQSGRAAEADEIAARIRQLQDAIFRQFWSPGDRAMASFIQGGKLTHFCDLVQALSLKTGVLPPDCAQQALERVYSRTLIPMTYSSLPYQWMALMDRGPAARQFCAATAAQCFEPMILKGATSLWETPLAGSDFGNAGSLCHAWSALPAYHCHAYVLGVRPLEIGFRKFLISPYPDRLFEARGKVPTPSGPIQIAWRKTDRGLVIHADGPRHLEPVLRPLEEAPIAEAFYGNRVLNVEKLG